MTKRRRTPQPAEISKKLRTALDSMVERGLEMQEAAKEAGMTTRGLRLALQRPAVLRYLRRARADLILSIRATTPRRLRQLRDQDENKAAAVAAGRLLEDLGDEVVRGEPGSRMPGFNVIVVNQLADGTRQSTTVLGPMRTIEHAPATADDDENDK